jgi:multiple sugar transport system substrate-binding protein
MFRKRSILVLLIVALALTLSAVGVKAQDQIKLTLLTHWAEQSTLKAQQAMFDAYMKANPNVTIELQTVPFDDLLTKINTGNTAGTNPDIYHVYNLWLPDFIKGGLLATPPDDMVKMIKANVPESVINGITVNGQVWGFPTEINTYLLLYNKKLLQEAGFTDPPKTWDELKKMAVAMTKKDSTGAVTQVGFAVWPGWDSGIVHPFSALLFSDGGQYLSDDFSKTAFNSPQGKETLQLYADLLKEGGMDMSMPAADFPNGTVGMVIMADWWRATLQTSDKIKYDDVGVAPIPVGPSGKDSVTLSYNWLWSVDAKSKHPDEAWKFLQWINSETAAGKGSPMGDYLVHALGAMPSMLYDQKAFQSDLSDHFLAPFVASTAVARPEPVIAGGQEVKTDLQTGIEGLLTGLSDVDTALQTAADEGDAVLAENKTK